MKLHDIAHCRTGDKGNTSNISVIVYDPADYSRLRDWLTPERVKGYFASIVHGQVRRFELPQLGAMNFVLDDALGGGVTRTLSLDMHGKSLGSALLNMELPWS